MKNSLLRLAAVLFFIALFTGTLNAQTIGIGTDTPDTTSILEIQSNEKGLLVPRMTTAERLAIPSPANALLVYDTDSTCFFYYKQTTTSWINLCNAFVETDPIFGSSVASGISMADTAYWNAIEAIANAYTDAETAARIADVDAEEARALAAEAALNAALNQEISDRIADVNAEEARALAAEAALTVALNQEISDRIADVDAEEARALAAEAALSTAINNHITADLDLDTTNELQTLSILGSDITLSDGGGTVSVPSSADNLGNHSATTNLTMNGFDLDMVRGDIGEIRSVGSISFDWTAGTYDDAFTHGIMSTDENANPGDDISINSFDDVTVRLDANNNDATSYFKVENHSSGNGTDLFWVRSGDGNAYHSGSLGIGTTSPAEDLHVYRADNDIARIYATGANQGSGLIFAGQSTTLGGGFSYNGDGAPAMVGGTDRITFFRRSSGTDTDVMSYAYNNSTVRISSLAGSGNRMVIANGSGDLSTQAIPSGDNLGNHIATTTLNLNSQNITNAKDIFTNNYGTGMVGVYSSSRYQHIFSMGSAYRLAADGLTPGNMYGLAWTHSNVAGESIAGLGHQLLLMTNGDTRTALGDGIWTKYNVTANRFYDQNNTSFYADPASTSYFNDMRADIYYDRNNTSYYVNPASSSNVNILYAASTGIGTTSPSAVLDVVGLSEFNGNVGINVAPSGTVDLRVSSSGGIFQLGSAEQLADAGANTFSSNSDLDPTSHLVLDMGASTLAWDELYADNFNNISDRRSKKNIKELKYGLQEIIALNPVSYVLKEDLQEETKLGLVAQEALSIIPEAVKTHDMQFDESGNMSIVELDRMAMRYNMFIPVLINGMQEQQKQIEEQIKLIKELQERLDKLED